MQSLVVCLNYGLSSNGWLKKNRATEVDIRSGLIELNGTVGP